MRQAKLGKKRTFSDAHKAKMKEAQLARRQREIAAATEAWEKGVLPEAKW